MARKTKKEASICYHERFTVDIEDGLSKCWYCKRLFHPSEVKKIYNIRYSYNKKMADFKYQLFVYDEMKARAYQEYQKKYAELKVNRKNYMFRFYREEDKRLKIDRKK